MAAISSQLHAQNPVRAIQGASGRMRSAGSLGTQDSLQHRTGLEDSITIRFRYLDSSRLQLFDSSIVDFTRKFPIPWYAITLGNLGNAVENRRFHPIMEAGWDHGFHAYDPYNFTIDETRFFNTTRPYSEIGYMVGTGLEQLINILHTQNIKPNWNASIQYRLINSPGIFQNQNTSHNSYRLTSWYQSKNKRYSNFFIIVANKLGSGDNGGISSEANYLDSSSYLDSRFNIPTQIGGSQLANRNPFSTDIATGTTFTNASYFLRQQYDLGQKDSIVVNDSTIIPLFYPRVRFEHSIRYSTYKYRFKDFDADSAYYNDNYKFNFSPLKDSFVRQDFWKELINDFSIYQFPDAKNSQQFIKVGASFQVLKGDFDTGLVKKSYTNLWLHGEYRNKTRNRKWDIEAYGSFYLSGLNAGDYNAHLSLQRLLSEKLGYLRVGFENVNRTPSFVFNSISSFYFDQAKNLNKENTTHIYAALERPKQRLVISGSYYLLSNYTYLRNFYEVAQASSLFNVLRVTVEKDFLLGKKGFHWRTWVMFQQKAGNAELNLPLIYTRNQLAYDGNFGFRNLRISTGLEFRYFTPYKANNYSPLQGQFFYQDTVQISLRRPEIAAYVHFRIKAFTAYVRAENLNAVDIKNGGFSKNNIVAPNYPTPGLQMRLGIFWSFVN
ncbi:MAG: hypothetical protein H7Y31_10430 [Chitinophagaceae bacterium]|nr:hypothetical protein [Chitinophagaceae bacterium]